MKPLAAPTFDSASHELALAGRLESYFNDSCRDGELIVVAFSGGPDSTALLWLLAGLAAESDLRLHAAHLDHSLDADSRRRAAEARQLASRLGVPVTVERLRAPRPSSESLEAFARHQRYDFLDRVANRLGARWIVTAHHADDQAETVLLRLLFGSGLEGLAAMEESRGRLARPLLGVRRADLRRALESSELEPVHDPTNLNPRVPRTAVRLRLLPHLEAREPGIAKRLCRLAKAARRANRKIEAMIEPNLGLRPIEDLGGRSRAGMSIDRRLLERVPELLWSRALSLLHRRVGAAYPASAAARKELTRQIHAGGALGCDCGDGWRWEGDAASLRLIRGKSSTRDFAYNLNVPGSVDIVELNVTFRLEPGRTAPWMFSGHRDRAGLASNLLTKRRVQVRNRRPGDRIQPLGSSKRRRLKELLIDRKIPRSERDRLPLLLIDGEIAWVPGVTIAEPFRLAREALVHQAGAWVATIESRFETNFS